MASVTDAIASASGADYLNAGAKVLSSMFGGSGPAAPSSANGNTFDTRFDSSGWNVNFGNGGIASDRTSNEAKGTAAGGGINSTTVILLIAGVVVWKLLKKH